MTTNARLANGVKASLFLMILLLCFGGTGLAEMQKTVKRVRLEKGETTAIFTGTLSEGEMDEYVLAVKKGQKISATITSDPPGAAFEIDGPQGILPNPDGAPDSWSGTFRASGEIWIDVSVNVPKTTYHLKVTFPKNRS